MDGGHKETAARRRRLALFALTSVLLLFAAVRVYATFTAPWWADLMGNDFRNYLHAIERWLATGSPYVPSEIAGPFQYTSQTFLHPPITFALFYPFLFLPWALWWSIPLCVAVYATLIWKPAPWTWPLMALPLVLYPIGAIIINGNTDLWMWAAFAAGLRWGWPAAFMVFKPSVAIFALVGITSKWWWVIVVGFGLYSLALIPWWIEWVKVVLNSPGSLLYSAGNVWMFLIPVIARIGRTDGPYRDWVPLGHRLGLAVGRWEDRLAHLDGPPRRRHDRGADRRTV